MQDNHILSVSDLTAAVKHQLENAFPFVWVRGQVTGVSRPSSGHLYFSLRDEQSSIAAVWFKGRQSPAERFDPLTGEVYEEGPRPSLALSLENGQEIICAGKLAVYGARGVYQLLVEIAQPAGLGRLHEEFERLRAKLEGLGYFAPERKRPLPPHPERIALLTAPNGAAIHDFVRIAESRGLSSRIRLYPVPVQGDTAAPAVVRALERIRSEGWAQVAVIIRGGGSLEDLWAFNDEALARTVFSFPLPILAGIGHEIDFTLTDLTADLRAATPSHAAQLLWPDRDDMRRRLGMLSGTLETACRRVVNDTQSRFSMASRALSWYSPERRIDGWGQSLRSSLRLLDGAWSFVLQHEENRLQRLQAGLAPARSRPGALAAPLAALEKRLSLAAGARIGHKQTALDTAFASLLRAPDKLPPKQTRLAELERRLELHAGHAITRADHALDTALLRLEAVNPHAPLARGYALVSRPDGSFVRAKNDVLPGDALLLTVSDGDIAVRVQGEKNDTV